MRYIKLMLINSQMMILILVYWLSFGIISQAQSITSVTKIIELQNNSSRLFFEAGRQQLEREIDLLENHELIFHDQILEISQNLSFIPAHFDASPRFIQANNRFYVGLNSRTNYQFTVELPSNAGANLQSLTIIPKDHTEQINFNLEQTQAYLSPSNETISVNSFEETNLDQSQSIKIVFGTPIQPGNTIIISLEGNRPSNLNNGFYNFGIWATPSGNNPQNLYLGSRTIVFP